MKFKFSFTIFKWQILCITLMRKWVKNLKTLNLKLFFWIWKESWWTCCCGIKILNSRSWFYLAEILQHQKLERTTLCSILRLRLFIFRRGADKRRRSRLLFLRPQNAAQPHFSVVKMKSETVKLYIKWSARASDFRNALIKFQLRKPGALI